MPNTSDSSTAVQRNAECPGVPRAASTDAPQGSSISASRRSRPAPFAAAGARLGRRGVVLLLTLGMAAAGFLWLKVIVPFTPLEPIPCPFEYVTGYECPGCGLQSSLSNLFALRWKYVLMANVLSPVLLPLFFIVMISGFAEILFGVTVWRFELPRWLIVTGVIVVIVYGVLRNIPSLGIW